MPASRPSPIRCPYCGATMNCHAEKLILISGPAGQGLDDDLGGYIEEMHACPRCGNIESRRQL